MRYFITLAFWLICACAHAQDWEDVQLFGTNSDTKPLRILSSTDTSFFVPIIQSFLTNNPDVQVEYLVHGTAKIDEIFRAQPEEFDIVISSAMDLQLKLVNDGFASQIPDLDHPNWAQWRSSLFGFTTEPAAIVINRAAFEGYEIPKTRQDLIRALRDRPDMFRDKLATYDVRRSGLGYLFATQDARASETYWRLMEIMGGLGTDLYCCSGDMIDDLVAGKISVAYNVLGSYATARMSNEAAIEVILPSDFPTTMMRTTLMSKQTDMRDTSVSFIQHLVDFQSKPERDAAISLPALDAREDQSTIALKPALLTYLDQLKRDTFIAAWEHALVQ